jgi:hypothetical protein
LLTKGNNIFVAQPQCEFVEDYHKTSGYNIVVKIAMDCNKRFIDMFMGLPTKMLICRDPSFGLVTKAKGLQGCGPRGSSGVKTRGSLGVKTRRSPGVTSHIPGSVRKCEGV